MKTQTMRTLSRLILILIGITMIVCMTMGRSHKTSDMYSSIDVNYDDFVYHNTKNILGVDLKKDKDIEIPIEDIEEVEEVEEEPVEVSEPAPVAYTPSYSSSIIDNAFIDHILFEEVITEISPNLSGIGKSIVDNYNEYGLKPSFQLAVFCLESGYGKSGLSQDKNNICGLNAYPTSTLTAYQNAFSYDTKGDCASHFADIIYKGYISNGRTTVDSVAKKYCPPNSINWTNSVMKLMGKIESAYAAKTI